MLLAADVGATKTLLGLFSPGAERPEPLHSRTFPTLAFGNLGDIVAAFLDEHRLAQGRVAAACFGVAGPVVGSTARLTNVPWVVDAAALGARFSLPQVSLLNDLEAMACAVPVLVSSELEVLQAGRAVPGGHRALIAAGTGLGEAALHHVGGRLVPVASEGGHADFAARTPAEIRVLQELTRTFGRVDVERVVSGRGLVNIHRALHATGCAESDAAADPAEIPSLISRAALDRRCPRCIETLDVFVSAYGAEAGNLALRTVATGGVYIGGGIAPKILPALEDGRFIDAFRAKAPLDDFMAAIPVSVILNDTAALLGAAVHALAAGAAGA
jgi:glucokinase